MYSFQAEINQTQNVSNWYLTGVYFLQFTIILLCAFTTGRCRHTSDDIRITCKQKDNYDCYQKSTAKINLSSVAQSC